jgi:hypothetical protein
MSNARSITVCVAAGPRRALGLPCLCAHMVQGNSATSLVAGARRRALVGECGGSEFHRRSVMSLPWCILFRVVARFRQQLLSGHARLRPCKSSL